MSFRLPFLILALAASTLGFGQDVEVEADPDPPGRVARVSVVQGDVSFQAEDAQAPEQALLNRPVTNGDRLMTEADSRAELSLGIAAVRLDQNTDLSVSNLDEDIAHFEVNSGAVSVRLRELPEGDTFEIDTPNATVRLMRPGDYRVDVLMDGSTKVAVRTGDAQIDSGSGPVNVHDQQQARLLPNSRYADVVMLGTPDAFDEWSMDRERELEDSQATRYVSREVVGYEDLDRYGDWSAEPEYGEVWVPRSVVAGWAPYSFGRWVWVGPWGWTWVDHSPWGFAPFHYGRWAFVRHRWCWVPGPRHHRPFYSPAHVAWTDHRGGHFSRDRRPDGWIPLGPREVYVPGRRVSPRYLRNVNVSNTFISDNTHITNAYRNRGRDWQYVNRNAPGVGARYGFNGSQWQNAPGGTSVQPGDGRGRWVTSPGGRNGFNGRGPNTDRRVDNDPRFNDGRRFDNDRRDNGRRWDNNNDRDRRWNGDGRSDGNRRWTNPGSSLNDGHMTIPRTPTDPRTTLQGDLRRQEREAAANARRFDRSTDDGRNRRYDTTNDARRWNDNRNGAGNRGGNDYRNGSGNRDWNNNRGGSDNRGWNNNRGGDSNRNWNNNGGGNNNRNWNDNRGYRIPGGPGRSYGGESRSNGGSSYRNNPSPPRAMPQPRSEPSRSWQSRSADSRPNNSSGGRPMRSGGPNRQSRQ